MSIEVEKKFQPEDPDSLTERILRHGGATLGQRSFVDVYFDSADCVLTRRDTWLRRRGDAWELKVPLGDPGDRSGASGGERTVFREVVGEEDVAAVLAPMLPIAAAGLAQLIDANALEPIAEYETTRSRYTLGACSLDADVASFGHSVLEIEVLAQTTEEVQWAEDEIARVATLLGTKPLGGTGGKLETYIRTRRPDVFAQLVDAGILQALAS